LSMLLRRYEQELEERSLADLARIFELAAEAAAGQHRWSGLPVLILDVPLDATVHREFLTGMVEKAPTVFAAVSYGCETFETILGVVAESLDSGAPSTSIEHLRAYLFDPAPPASVPDNKLELFSAPGEGLEAVEIARRVIGSGVPFDQ